VVYKCRFVENIILIFTGFKSHDFYKFLIQNYHNAILNFSKKKSDANSIEISALMYHEKLLLHGRCLINAQIMSVQDSVTCKQLDREHMSAQL
jgi:hypothetical protein